MDSIAAQKLEYNNSEIVYWVWLSLACRAGGAAPNKLFAYFGADAKKIYNAAPEEYEKAGKIREEIITSLCDKSLSEPFSILAWCRENKVGILPYDSEYFPESLRIINRCPVLLYYVGRVPDLRKKLAISVVGTRSVSDNGTRNAYTLAVDLAMAGLVVVSGMALGVDGIAHRGTLDAGGYTIAVLGCGIDYVYPKEHRNLMNEIMHFGTVVTEYCPGTRPSAKSFPIRNRIISGLSQGTVIVEAGVGSGSLITAADAEKEGRRVYAMPGDVGFSLSEGTNNLLKNGTKVVTNALDIIDDFRDSYACLTNIENIYNKIAKFHHDHQLDDILKSRGFPMYPPLGAKNSSEGRMISGDLFRYGSGSNPAEKKKPARRTETRRSKQASHATEESSVPVAMEESLPMPELSENGLALYKEILSGRIRSYDDASALDISYSDFMSELMMLEMSGIVETKGGMITGIKPTRGE